LIVWTRTGILVILLLLETSAHGDPIQVCPDNPHSYFYQGKPIVLITSAEHYGQFMPPFGGMWDYHPPKHHNLPHERLAAGSRDSTRWCLTELLCNLEKGTVRAAAADAPNTLGIRNGERSFRADSNLTANSRLGRRSRSRGRSRGSKKSGREDPWRAAGAHDYPRPSILEKPRPTTC
jgi:hypothetical protein